MLDLDLINKEIEKLEQCNCTTYGVCNKLATLYTVRHFYSKHKDSEAEKEYQSMKMKAAPASNQI